MGETPKSGANVPSTEHRFRRFILPDDSVNLKVVFDNLRNYLICGALIVAIEAVVTRQSLLDLFLVWPPLVKALVYALLITNVIQSWLIFDQIETAIVRHVKSIGAHWDGPVRWAVRLFLLMLWFPVMVAAYQVVPALAQWAAAGGRLNAL